MNLDELLIIDRTATALAERMPESTRDALSMYVQMRRNRLRENLSSRPDYEVQDYGKRLKALRELEDLVKTDTSVEPLPHRPPKGETAVRYQAYLSDLLTPEGWQQDLLPTLNALLETCDLAFEEGSDVSGAKALRKEIEILIAVLQNVDRNGRGARLEMFEKEIENGWTAQSR